jgi:hypothetical protein
MHFTYHHQLACSRPSYSYRDTSPNFPFPRFLVGLDAKAGHGISRFPWLA